MQPCHTEVPWRYYASNYGRLYVGNWNTLRFLVVLILSHMCRLPGDSATRLEHPIFAHHHAGHIKSNTNAVRLVRL